MTRRGPPGAARAAEPRGPAKPGMFAQADLLTSVPRGPWCRRRAARHRADEQFVFVTEAKATSSRGGSKRAIDSVGRCRFSTASRTGEQVAASAPSSSIPRASCGRRSMVTRRRPASRGAFAAPSHGLDIALTSVPDPPRAGMNQSATVTTPGRPAGDRRDVTLCSTCRRCRR